MNNNLLGTTKLLDVETTISDFLVLIVRVTLRVWQGAMWGKGGVGDGMPYPYACLYMYIICMHMCTTHVPTYVIFYVVDAYYCMVGIVVLIVL